MNKRIKKKRRKLHSLENANCSVITMKFGVATFGTSCKDKEFSEVKSFRRLRARWNALNPNDKVVTQLYMFVCTFYKKYTFPKTEIPFEGGTATPIEITDK